MELTIKERLILLQILPKVGNIVILRTLKELHEALQFTEDEISAFSLNVNDGQVLWNEEVAHPVEVDIGGTHAKAIITTALAELETAGKIPLDGLSLYEKFMEEEK